MNTAIASATQFAGNSLHSATVEAVLSFARALTKQLEDRWIRVNAVSSGTQDVPRVTGKTVQQESLHSALQLDIPITPDYIAAMVVSFLCDDKTGLTGAELSLEGGALRLGEEGKNPVQVEPLTTLARFGFSCLIFAASSLRLKIGGDAEFLPNSCFL